MLYLVRFVGWNVECQQMHGVNSVRFWDPPVSLWTSLSCASLNLRSVKHAQSVTLLIRVRERPGAKPGWDISNTDCDFMFIYSVPPYRCWDSVLIRLRPFPMPWLRQTPASFEWRTISIPGQYTWDLWWTMLNGTGFCPSTSVFPCQYHSTIAPCSFSHLLLKSRGPISW